MQQALGVPAVGQARPHEHPALRAVPGRARGQRGAEAVQQRVAARAVGRAQPGDVRVEVDAGEVRRGRRAWSTVEVCRSAACLATTSARAQRRRGRAASRSAGPARAPWRTCDTAIVRSSAPGSAATGGSGAPRVAQLAVGVVLDDPQPVRARRVAASARRRSSGSVRPVGFWKVGISVQQPRRGAAPSRPPARPDRGPRRRRRRARAARRRARSTAAPRGRTAPRRAPRRRARAARRRRASAPAASRCVTSTSSGSVGRPRPPSRAAIAARSAGSPSVVEYCSVAGRGQRRRERLGQPARDRKLGGRQAAGERDDAGARGQREDVADGRALDAREACGRGRRGRRRGGDRGLEHGRTVPDPGGPPGVHGAAYPVRRRTSPQMEPNERPHAAPVQPPLSPPA